MGYDAAAAREALAACGGDVAAAVGSLGSGSPARGSPPRGGGRRADHLLRFTSDRDRPSKPAPRQKARPHKAFRARGIAFEQSSAHLLVDAPACSPLVADADCAPDWADVVALDVFGGEYVDCPVCLDAARMPVAARCGHVFCGPCVVRHAKMDDVSRSARCPCCGGPLRVGDLRPCRVRQRDAPPAAAKRAIELVLLRRPRSARAPRAHCERGDGDLCEPLGKLTACDGAAFERAWARFDDAAAAAAAAADDSVERRDVAVAVEALAAVRAAAASRPRDAVDVPLDAAEKAYYFYGRRDGALEFLHPLFLKLLLAAAGGDSDALPRTLTATVSHVERVEQTEEARKRFPWAAHVPLGTDFALLDATKISGDGDDAWAKRCADARRADEGLDAGLRERADAVRKERDRAKRDEKRHAKHGEALLPKKADPFAYSRSDFGRLSSEAVPIPGAGARVGRDDDDDDSDDGAEAAPALGSSPNQMSFAATVNRDLLSVASAFPELGGGRAPAPAPPPPRWGRPAAAPPPAESAVVDDAGEAVDFGGSADLAGALATALAGVDAASPPRRGKKGGRKKVLLSSGGGRRYD